MGVHFHVTDQNGSPVGASNGDYVTDQNGQIVIENLTPGMTVTAKETRTVSGYVLNNEAQSILIKEGEAQTLTFLNSPKGSLTIRKLDSLTEQPLSGAEFRVTSVNGEPVADNEGRTSSNGIFRTDANGQFTIANLQPGVYTVTETKAPEGYVMDAAPQTVTVEADDAQTLTFRNAPKQTLVVTKFVRGSTTPIAGTEFLITDSRGTVIGPDNGKYVTDADGRIVIHRDCKGNESRRWIPL